MSINPDPEQDIQKLIEATAQSEAPAEPVEEGEVTSEAEQKKLFSDGYYDNFEQFIAHEKFRLQFKEFKLRKENEDSERQLRERHAEKTHNLTIWWAVFIAAIILLHGWSEYSKFKLSEIEFLAVIGGLTSSMLIFYLVVIKFLFYREKKNNIIEQ